MARETILVVEDESITRKLVVQTLTSADFVVIEAADGLSGLRCMEAQTPAVVILDVMMPGAYSGFDVLYTIRSNRHYDAVKVIMLTACDEEESYSIAGRCGADKYLKKPFNLSLLPIIVEDLLD